MIRGFVFLASYYTALQHLNEEDRKLMYAAIIQYAFTEKTPELPEVLSGYFELMQPVLDSSIRKYNAACENPKKKK